MLVHDPAKRTTLATPFPAMPWIGYAPAFLVFLGDTWRLERLGQMNGHPAGNQGLEGFFNASVDAALALQTFILAAEDAGLGTCPISVLRNQAPLVATVLALPPGVFPVAGLCVGWPEGVGHASMRLPPSLTLHRDRYADTDLPGAVATYDAEREARNPTPPRKQRAPERFGTARHRHMACQRIRRGSRRRARARRFRLGCALRASHSIDPFDQHKEPYHERDKTGLTHQCRHGRRDPPYRALRFGYHARGNHVTRDHDRRHRG